MRIGELAHRAGVSVRSLRYYEEQGLVPADRTSGGHREYPESAVGRVRFIQQLYSAGLPSTAISGAMPFLDTGVVTAEMQRDLEGEQERLQEKIDQLTLARDRLVALRAFAAEANGRRVECTVSGGFSVVS